MSYSPLQSLKDLHSQVEAGTFNASSVDRLIFLIDQALAVASPSGIPEQIRDARDALANAQKDADGYRCFSIAEASQKAWSGQAAVRSTLAINSCGHSVDRITAAFAAAASTLNDLADDIEGAQRKDQDARARLVEARDKLDFDVVDWIFDQEDNLTHAVQDATKTCLKDLVTAAETAEKANKVAADELGGLAADAPAHAIAASHKGMAPVDLMIRADAAQKVYGRNFPDPGILKVGDTYYAYATNAAGKNVQVLMSKDLENWTVSRDALPNLGRWAVEGSTWAPEVMQLPNGKFAMYYTAKSGESGHQAVGVAIADNPAGPFVDQSGKPLISGSGDVLDASPFKGADDKVYLHWKDGASYTIYGQELEVSDNGQKVTGEKAPLLKNHADWHGNVVEAPQMHVRDGKHYLIYSGSTFDNPGYSVGYAECDGPLGPCRDAPAPILSSEGGAVGPGHASMVTGPDGTDRLIYHAWEPGKLGEAPGRVMWLDRVEWVDGKPVVRGPAG